MKQTDSAGNTFIELDSWLRVTLVKNQDGYESVRIQVVNEKGKVIRGPQVPLEMIGRLTQALVDLLKT